MIKNDDVPLKNGVFPVCYNVGCTIRRLRGRLRGVCRKMKQNMPTPAYAPQQTAYIRPCAGQLSYKSLLVKKNSAHMKIHMPCWKIHHLCR